MAFILMSTVWGSEDRKVTVYCLLASGVRLFWVSKTVELERMLAVIAWLAGMAAKPSSAVRVTALGDLMIGWPTTTVTVVAAVAEPAELVAIRV